jgi:hypothetical protein
MKLFGGSWQSGPLMGGEFGIGGNSAKTDRGNQLAATQGDWNIFNASLPTGEAQQATGTTTLQGANSALGPAQNYYQNLLTAGRTQTAAQSAPAINSVLASTDATRNSAGTFGTSRTGGTASLNRTAGTGEQSQVDNIINQNLQTGKQQGASGLTQVAGQKASIGGTELQNAMAQLGLSSSAVNDILSNATTSRGQSNQINQQSQQQYGTALGNVIAIALGL